MAVQAQYPSNVWLSDFMTRNGQEKKELLDAAIGSDYAFEVPDQKFIDALGSIPQSNSAMAFLQQPQPQQQYHHQQQQQERTCMINLEDLRLPVAPSKPVASSSPSNVFTGLRLSLEDQQQNQPSNTSFPSTNLSFVADDLSLLLNQHQQEIDHLVRVQSDQLRRSLIGKRQKQCGALVAAVERIATRRLREKESERERVARRNAELEEKVGQLLAEARFWQAKAQAQEAIAATLQARLTERAQQSSRVADEVDDAESSTSEPDHPERGLCRACKKMEASVVVLPCRHLSICSFCAQSLGACPLCRCVRTACIQAYLS
ncbi:unnamed protein product [Victoria cruziana]